VADFEKMVRAYWGTVLSVDDSVGRLVAYLKQTGQYENTVIVFMGDNGLLEGEHGMVDKRTMHEPSIRVPLIARGPGLPRQATVTAQVLTEDIAPSILDLCDAQPLQKIHGRSWRQLANGADAGWRTAWLYEYNYEKQFPYTPNIRGIRTDRWKYVRYPHGDGSPDRHTPEFYDLQEDPLELTNLAEHPAHAERRLQLEQRLAAELSTLGLTPERDTMPIDEGIKTELPDAKIR
jgi:arylsulfatase A-like enzyme